MPAWDTGWVRPRSSAPSFGLVAVMAAVVVMAACSADTSAPAEPATIAQTEPTATPVATAAATPSTVASPDPTAADVAATPAASPTPMPTAAATQGAAPDSNCARITDFDDQGQWRIVNDGVMGGLSDGRASVVDGVLVFDGVIVTDGGGFSMVRTPLAAGDLDGAATLRFRVRSDGRAYELIADDDQQGSRSSISHFGAIASSVGDWQEADVALDALSVRSFGNPVDADPFRPDLAVSIGVILADGIDGPFTLEVDWIDACG